jgi:hypothetical protein
MSADDTLDPPEEYQVAKLLPQLRGKVNTLVERYHYQWRGSSLDTAKIVAEVMRRLAEEYAASERVIMPPRPAAAA